MPRKKFTLSREMEKIQRAKLAARPPALDISAALALHSKALNELMDDKYLALSEELSDIRRGMRQHDKRWHGSVVSWAVRAIRHRWKVRQWFRYGGAYPDSDYYGPL